MAPHAAEGTMLEQLSKAELEELEATIRNLRQEVILELENLDGDIEMLLEHIRRFLD